MDLISLNRNLTERQLRIFAIILLIGFSIITYFWYALGRQTTFIFMIGGFGIIIGMVGTARPKWIYPIYLGLSYVTYPIGWVVSHLILFLIFFFLFTPVGLIMRIFGYDPMKRKFRRSESTYWTTRKSMSNTKRYFEQF